MCGLARGRIIWEFGSRAQSIRAEAEKEVMPRVPHLCLQTWLPTWEINRKWGRTGRENYLASASKIGLGRYKSKRVMLETCWTGSTVPAPSREKTQGCVASRTGDTAYLSRKYFEKPFPFGSYWSPLPITCTKGRPENDGLHSHTKNVHERLQKGCIQSWCKANRRKGT